MRYVNDLIASWAYPFIALNERDTAVIGRYVRYARPLSDAEITRQAQELKIASANEPRPAGSPPLNDKQLREAVIESNRNMGIQYLTGIDAAIIGTAFCEFAMEGKIDRSLKDLAVIALNRELSGLVLSYWDERDRPLRRASLEKMLGVILVIQIIE